LDYSKPISVKSSHKNKHFFRKKLHVSMCWALKRHIWYCMCMGAGSMQSAYGASAMLRLIFCNLYFRQNSLCYRSTPPAFFTIPPPQFVLFLAKFKLLLKVLHLQSHQCKALKMSSKSYFQKKCLNLFSSRYDKDL